jgi:hypothetical protein
MGQVVKVGSGSGPEEKYAGSGVPRRALAIGGGIAALVAVGGLVFALTTGGGPGGGGGAGAAPSTPPVAQPAVSAQPGTPAVASSGEPAPIQPGHPEWDARHGSDVPK